MSFKKDDVVVFDDDSKVLVMDAIMHAGKEYLFVNVLDANEEFTNVYKVYNANYQTGNFDKVSDKSLLEQLLPVFYEDLAQEVVA